MKNKLIIFVLVISIFTMECISQIPDASQPQKKIALVIGNGNYQSGSILANPENDAKAMKVALLSVGFTVLEYVNLSQSQMKKAIDDFGEKLKSNEVGLFFYAGHGIQAKGYNYLIPIDAELKSEQQVEYDCVQADRVLALMEASGAKVNIIILDACRNNPFERSWTRSATGKGLAFMNAPSGTLIAYATSPGSTASDGSGKNGLYTSAILESIQIPNLSIIQMFQNVRSIVSQKSSKQQIPWESTSLIGDFYFNFNSTFANSPAIQNIVSENEKTDNKTNYTKTPLTNNFSNEIKVVKIIKKPNNYVPTDTVLYATLNQGLNAKIRQKSFLNLFLPTYSESPISGEKILSKPKKIGHIYITSSFNNTSEGELSFKGDFNYNKLFDPNISYAKIKETWSTVYVSTRINNGGSPGIGGGFMLYNRNIGGYIEGGIFSSSGSYSEALFSAGVIKSITYTSALKIGMGYDGQLTVIEIGAVTRFKNISLLYGLNAGIDKGGKWIAEGNTYEDFYAFGLSFGLGYNF